MVGSLRWPVLGAALAVAALALASPAAADPAPPAREDPPNGLCLACHRNEGLTVSAGDEERELEAVDRAALKASVHREMKCVSCHTPQSAIPHAEPEAETAGGDRFACARCHIHAYESYLETPHGTLVHLGDGRGPACGDCHGPAHEVRPVAAWTEDERAAACGECHQGAGPAFLEALSHEEPSSSFLPIAYFAGKLLVLLTASVLAFGIIHVELDVLRWLARRRRRGDPRTESS